MVSHCHERFMLSEAKCWIQWKHRSVWETCRYLDGHFQRHERPTGPPPLHPRQEPSFHRQQHVGPAPLGGSKLVAWTKLVGTSCNQLQSAVCIAQVLIDRVFNHPGRYGRKTGKQHRHSYTSTTCSSSFVCCIHLHLRRGSQGHVWARVPLQIHFVAFL